MFPVLVHCSCICRFILPKLLSTVEKIRVCLKMLDLSPPYCHLVGGLEHEFYFSPCHSDWRVLVIHLDRKLVSIQDILVYRLLAIQGQYIYIYVWLVVWNIFYFSIFSILGIIIPTDFHIFQRGWNHQPDVYCTLVLRYSYMGEYAWRTWQCTYL